MSDLQAHQNPTTVSLDVIWQGSSGRHDARMSEISMDGCFIDTKVQGRTLGEIVEFKVHLPDGPWVSLQGELVSQEYPIGCELRFTGLTEGDRRLLSQVVAAHGGLPAEAHSAVPDGAVQTPSPMLEAGGETEVLPQAASD